MMLTKLTSRSHGSVAKATIALVATMFCWVTAPADGQTLGTLDDTVLLEVPYEANRIYYLSDNWANPDEDTPSQSVLPNALGVDQVLFYDVYPPTGPRAKATVLYLHGGGYTVGRANNAKIVAAVEQLRALGHWVVSIEYRRGWYAGGDLAVGGDDITADDAALGAVAYEMALDDVLAAWDHLSTEAAERFPFPPRFVVIGQSAGGSLASRATLIEPPNGREISGLIVGYGTHLEEELVMEAPDFPVVIQGGVWDTFALLFTNHAYFDLDMPRVKGFFNLYDELDALGAETRLLLSAQTGHGLGAYELCDGTIEHYPEALAFFEDVYYGASYTNFVEYKFKCDNSLPAGIKPGDRIDTLTFPDFVFDPYIEELSTGQHPDEVRAFHGVSACPNVCG